MDEDLLGEGQVERGVDLDGEFLRHFDVSVLLAALQYSVFDLRRTF